MRTCALSILACCALLLQPAEAARKGGSATKSAKSKGHSHKSKATAHRSAHRSAHRTAHAKKNSTAKKSVRHTSRKKVASAKGATKRSGASGRVQKSHTSTAKATHSSVKKSSTKASATKKSSASHVASKRHAFSAKRAGPTRGHLEKKNAALNARRDRAFGRLAPERRKRFDTGLARARQTALAARRPRVGAFTARKNILRPLPAARARTAFRLPAAGRTALGGLVKSTVAAERTLANRILNNRPLAPANRRLLNSLIRRERAATNPNRPLLNALGYAWRADLSRRFLNRALLGLVRLGRGAPLYRVFPGGTVEAPLYTGPGGISFTPPPGFDPSAGAVVTLEDENKPSGLAIVSSLDPNNLGWANLEPTAEDDPDSEADVDQPTIDSVWQTTRTLKVANATEEKIKVFLRYEAQDDAGNWQSYPDDTEGARSLVYDLEPGEVCFLKDGDWAIRARRVLIWAEGDGKQWVRYKTQELSLVPEPDDGYAAPRVQVFNLAFR
jgi:hypothetical protein